MFSGYSSQKSVLAGRRVEPALTRFGLGCMRGLCRLQKELDFDGFERKDNLAVLGAVKHTRVQQRRYVAVNRLHVAANATGRLAN